MDLALKRWVKCPKVLTFFLINWPLVSFKILALQRQGEGDVCSWKECCSCHEYACSGLFISLALALKAELKSPAAHHDIQAYTTDDVWKSLSCTTANNSVLFGANQRMGVRTRRECLSFKTGVFQRNFWLSRALGLICLSRCPISLLLLKTKFHLVLPSPTLFFYLPSTPLLTALLTPPKPSH